MTTPFKSEEHAAQHYRMERLERRSRETGIPVEELITRSFRARRELKEWWKALDALDYKPGEDPLDFLRRVNARQP